MESEQKESSKREDKTPFPFLVIFAIIFLISAVVIFIFVRNGDPLVESEVTPTPTTQPDSSSEVILPDYTMANSKVALSAINDAALAWSADAKLLNCSGSVLPYDANGTRYYIGSNDGEFASWSCFVYSEMLSQDTQIKWYTGTVTVDEPHAMWGLTEYEADPNLRSFFSTETFVSSADAMPTLADNGVQLDDEYVTFNFGLADGLETYGSQPVWQVNVYSRTLMADPNDEYSQGKRLRVLYIDGVTGDLLSTESAD